MGKLRKIAKILEKKYGSQRLLGCAVKWGTGDCSVCSFGRMFTMCGFMTYFET